MTVGAGAGLKIGAVAGGPGMAISMGIGAGVGLVAGAVARLMYAGRWFRGGEDKTSEVE